jgi:hypothetical protein
MTTEQANEDKNKAIVTDNAHVQQYLDQNLVIQGWFSWARGQVFYVYADAVGVPIPEPSPIQRPHIAERMGHFLRQWDNMIEPVAGWLNCPSAHLTVDGVEDTWTAINSQIRNAQISRLVQSYLVGGLTGIWMFWKCWRYGTEWKLQFQTSRRVDADKWAKIFLKKYLTWHEHLSIPANIGQLSPGFEMLRVVWWDLSNQEPM